MANAIPTIFFLGAGYVPHQHSNIGQVNDPRVKVLDDLAGPELVTLHNLVADNLGGKGRVRRFADKGTAVSRTWKKLGEFAATDPAISPELASYLGVAPAKADDFEMSEAELAKQKGRKPAGAAHPAIKLISSTDHKTVELSDTDKQQISDEAAGRKAEQPKKSEQLIAAAAAAGSVAQAQAALRNSPPASDNPAKDAEMPALRRTVKPISLDPKSKVYPRRAGSKQAVLVDLLSRPQGATFGELYDGLAATGKPWRGVTIRSGLAWDMNHIAGYGVTAELLNGEEFALQERFYEARRLGVVIREIPGGVEYEKGEGYDPELKLAVYRLTYPRGQTGPVPHTPKKG